MNGAQTFWPGFYPGSSPTTQGCLLISQKNVVWSNPFFYNCKLITYSRLHKFRLTVTVRIGLGLFYENIIPNKFSTPTHCC